MEIYSVRKSTNVRVRIFTRTEISVITVDIYGKKNVDIERKEDRKRRKLRRENEEVENVWINPVGQRLANLPTRLDVDRSDHSAGSSADMQTIKKSKKVDLICLSCAIFLG